MPSTLFRTFVAALSLALLGSSVRAQGWRVTDETRQTYGDVELIDKRVTGVGRSVQLTLVAFSTKDYGLKVIDQGSNQKQRKYSNLKAAMQAVSARAGVNGGFYGRDFRPLGLVVSDSRQIHPLRKSSSGGITSGIIWFGTGGIHIERYQSFSSSSGVEQALQTGPMLVWQGRGVSGLSDSNWRPRTFVLTDWKGKWMLGVSSAVTLNVLSKLLNDPKVIHEFTTNRAINLDGGRSTGLYVGKESGENLYRSEISQVRNFLGIVRK